LISTWIPAIVIGDNCYTSTLSCNQFGGPAGCSDRKRMPHASLLKLFAPGDISRGKAERKAV